jgi:LysR family glycine cleavage system transcriptional activator/LysR family transcriptional regulator of beta-lactamase
VPKGRAWYIVYRPYRETDAGLIAFRQWMREQFKMEQSRKRS